jgi:phenylacetate-CoA ligase
MKGGNEMQNLDPEERAQLQLERLQATLNRAYRNVPFHQNHQNQLAREKRKDPSLIESIKEIAAFPFMERKHLGEHYPYGLFAVPLRDIVRIHTAPGTTLNPTVTGYTRQDLRIWREMVSRALTAAGITDHDILQINLDPGLANWGRDYKDGAEALDVGVIPNTSLSPEKHLMVLRDYKTSALVTTPSGASQLAEYMFKTDLNPTALSLKHMILVGEPVGKDFRARLEEQLHITTWVHFGLSEVPGPAIAFECEQHEGLHVSEDHFLPEIIDPETGAVLPDGETGELVLTTLTTRAFPLIRFKTGERARLIQSPCPCGRAMIRMEWRPDRTDDILNINGVKVHQNQIRCRLEMALGESTVSRHFVRKKLGERNSLEVWVAVNEGLFSDEIKILEKQVRSLQEGLRENLGVPVTVRLKEGYSLTGDVSD